MELNTRRVRVYLVGPMTGIVGFNHESFVRAEQKLSQYGYTVINTSVLPKDLPEESYMPISLTMLEQADAIYVLEGYKESYGAITEIAYALKQNKMVVVATSSGYELLSARSLWGFESNFSIGFGERNAIGDKALDDKTLRDAIDAFGNDMQTEVAIEEMSELIKALVKYDRYPGLDTLMNIIEEIADVQIMLDQLKIIHAITDTDLSKVRADKITRLRDRIKYKRHEDTIREIKANYSTSSGNKG